MIYSFKMSDQTQKQEIPVPCELCGGYYVIGKSANAISALPNHLQCRCIVDNPTRDVMCRICKTLQVRNGIRYGFHPDDHSPCIPGECFRNERPRPDDDLSMFSQKEKTTADKGTQCNMCCRSFEQEESSLVSSCSKDPQHILHCVSSSDIPNSPTEISFCPVCDRVDRFNGEPVGEHSDIPGNCGSDRVSDIIWCKVCSTPSSVGGESFGHHTDDYRCVPAIEFLTSNYFQHSRCYSPEQFLVLLSRSLPNNEIPCCECGEVMVPNPENSDAVDRGYCEDCWTRR